MISLTQKRFNIFSIIICITLFIVLMQPCSTLQFILYEKSKSCFKEDFPLSTDVKFTYNVAQGDGEMPVNIYILDENQNTILSRKSVDHGVHGFKTPSKLPATRIKNEWTMHDDDKPEANFASDDDLGDNHLTYSFCFEHRGSVHLPHLSFRSKTQQRRVLFEINSGADMKDTAYYESLAKEKHLTSTEELFQVVEDRVSEIVRLIDEMQQRGQQMDHLSSRTTNSVTVYNILSCTIILVAAFIASHSTIAFFWKSKMR